MLSPARLSVRLSVCLSVCHTVGSVKKGEVRIMQLSPPGSPMTLVSLRLTSPRNSKGNIGNEGGKSERGRKHKQFSANKVTVSPKRCKIGSWLLLMTNRMSLLPKSMTLNDLERPKRTLSQTRCVFWSPLLKCE